LKSTGAGAYNGDNRVSLGALGWVRTPELTGRPCPYAYAPRRSPNPDAAPGNPFDLHTPRPVSGQLLTSPYDTDARCGAKRDSFWNGYKLHISETCSAPGPAHPADAAAPRCGAAPKPNLITNVATTDATVPDSKMLTAIHQALGERDLLPNEHYLMGR
jgi:hypothetical protein